MALGFSILFPILVIIVERFGGNAFIYGLASSIYPAFQLIGAPLMGRWSDIYGRKKNSALKSAWDTAFLVYFSWSFFYARALGGLTSESISVSNA